MFLRLSVVAKSIRPAVASHSLTVSVDDDDEWNYEKKKIKTYREETSSTLHTIRQNTMRRINCTTQQPYWWLHRIYRARYVYIYIYYTDGAGRNITMSVGWYDDGCTTHTHIHNNIPASNIHYFHFVSSPRHLVYYIKFCHANVYADGVLMPPVTVSSFATSRLNSSFSISSPYTFFFLLCFSVNKIKNNPL